MDDIKNKQLKGLLATIAMIIVGALLVVLSGELAKYFIAADTLYFSVINHIYLLAGAALLLWIGLGRHGLANIRNMICFFVLLLILLAVAYQVDRTAIGVSSTSGSLLISHVPEHYADMFLTALDGISLILGAAGAFLLLWKGLDKLKDTLSGAGKAVPDKDIGKT
jgi:ABC-type methionine transport system permease subunit